MSDMIDGLDKASREAGANAAVGLNASATIQSMQARVATGRRRRRQRLGAVAGVGVMALIAGVVVVPNLLEEVPVPPAQVNQREVVTTTGGLTVYADGGMSVVTDSGDVVEIAPPDPETYEPYIATSAEEACLLVPARLPATGWTFNEPSASSLISFGRPQWVDSQNERHVMAQGQTLEPMANGKFPPVAFEFDLDPSIADHVGLKETVVTELDGNVGWMVSQLDAKPKEVTASSSSSNNPLATLAARSLPANGGSYCPNTRLLTEYPEGFYRRYLIVEVFLTDHQGHSNKIATHTSWTGIEVSPT